MTEPHGKYVLRFEGGPCPGDRMCTATAHGKLTDIPKTLPLEGNAFAGWAYVQVSMSELADDDTLTCVLPDAQYVWTPIADVL